MEHQEQPDKQEAFPNLNRGGNEGNVYGAGRKRNSVRERFLDLTDREAINLAVSVIQGKGTFPAYDRGGKEYRRKPTLRDMQWAAEFLAKHAMSMGLTEGQDPDGKPVLVIDL